MFVYNIYIEIYVYIDFKYIFCVNKNNVCYLGVGIRSILSCMFV